MSGREGKELPGTRAVVWRLLTNRDAGTLEAVAKLIDWYRARWEIERLFHVLKNGYRVGATQLLAMDRLERMASVIPSRVVANCVSHAAGPAVPGPCRQPAVPRQRNGKPHIGCRTGQSLERRPGSTRSCASAGLGGSPGRKGDDEPGVKTLWIGWQRVMDFAIGLRYAREHQASCV